MRKLISADHVFPVETMVVLFFYFWENFIYMRWQLKFVFIYRVSTSINFLEKTSLCGFQHPNLKEDRWSFTIPIALPFITHQLLTYKILFNSVPCVYTQSSSQFLYFMVSFSNPIVGNCFAYSSTPWRSFAISDWIEALDCSVVTKSFNFVPGT